MMKLQGFIATARSLFGGHRTTFGFVVLPFVGVVLFPSPAICWSYAVPYSRHLELSQGTSLEGVHVFRGNGSSPASYVIPLLPSFLFF